MKLEHPVFPREFMWGASTASHQVEGGMVNDWSEWELANAQQLAKTAEERLNWIPIWDEIKQQAKNPDNYISGRGVEHYQRYEQDFDIVRQLNMNAFRFGIEWARLEPEEGKWDQRAVEHYRSYIAEMIERGIEPFLNLWHWTVPTWFAEKGGFAEKRNLMYFDRFVVKIAQEYGNHLTYIITLNEQNVYASLAYLMGTRPPQKKNLWLFIKVNYNLSLAHKRAYKILKAHKKHLQIGVAAQLANIQAKRPHNIPDQVSTKLMRYFWNWWFLKRIARYQDFVGINYYFTDYYTGMFKRKNPELPKNDLGWYMEPEGLYPLLLRTWVRFKKPIFITENGVADHKDQYRRWWIEESIVAMERALSEGVDLRGYFHWSLLDNFEWESGWWPKFGLVEVDREHGMKRTIRPSAKWFAQRIKEL